MGAPHKWWKSNVSDPPITATLNVSCLTDAESLIYAARAVREISPENRRELLSRMDAHGRCLIQLGYLLENNTAVAFRAIVEGWDRDRIRREVFK